MRGRIAVAFLLGILVAAIAGAQLRREGGGYLTRSLRYAARQDFDGSFQFCRGVFRSAANGDGNGWSIDYPRADQNLSIRLSELTKTSVGFQGEGTPKHLLLNMSSPELFHCPFIMMTEVGALSLDDAEAKGLREYLLKGGFLWADDFWGSYAWNVWESQIRRVLPSGMFPIADLPLDHPIFHTMFTLTRIPQIPTIGFWRGPGGPTSERGADSAVPHVRAISDARGRIMVLMTHNTDFGDAFEEEATNHQYFLTFSVDGYRFGVNTLVYAMTH
jgi:uncharacterized protein DUF4159